MFDEMPDHFLAAATSRTTNTSCSSTASLPLSFSLNQHANFDASFLLHHPHSPFQLQHQVTRTENKEPSVANSVLPASLSLPGCALPWSNEEVLSLLKIVSSMDNPWFPPEFTWENVSRKLAEIGFKRSADKCKEKFEDETRSFSTCSNNGNNSSNNSNKHNIISQNYRLFGELEDLYNSTTTTTNNNNGDYGNGELNPSNKLDDQLPNEDCNQDEDGVQEELGRIGEGKSGNDETGARGNIDNNMDEEEEEEDDDDQLSGDDSEKTEENTKKVERKRKREKKFEMFKGFCEKIVNKMIAQQEELHCKILQDMVKRDEEKIAREEAWKKQEIDRIAHELEVRAHEQAIVGDRQAKILGFLNKFSSSSNFESESLRETLGNVMMIKVPNNVSLSTSSSILSQDSISATTTTAYDQKSMSNLVSQQKCNLPMSLSKENLAPQSHNKLAMPISSSTLDQASKSPNVMTSISPHKSFGSDHTNTTDAAGQVMDFKSPEYEDDLKSRVGDVKDDTGRRWPRDEVLALINIRCTLFNNTNGDQHEGESFSKGPLWERISHKMIELGYKRSAKRCKEKWENINKYFRKTKDSNKKRSVDSRTCPYFHQLSHLYNQGTSLGQPDRSVTVVGSPGDQSIPSSIGQGEYGTTKVLGSQGNEGVTLQVSTGFGFEI